MTIPRRRIENVMGFHRGDGKTVAERAEQVREHVEALQSLYVQFQGVRRHGDKLHFEGDMTASPLWFVQMKAKGQGDLFTGEVTADWHVKAKEGVWGSEFLHNHGDQWAPLPKEWFDQIDRRGKDWAQRLAVRLHFLFRINAKRGGVVKLSAQKMLEICGTDLKCSPRRKTERKRRLSASLDALRDQYGIGVQAGRVHIRHTKNMPSEDWKRRVATFTPPDSIDGELMRNESDGRPRLPEVKGGDWTAAQIKRLRSDLGDTQSEFADRLGVSRQMVSRYENRHDPPSNKICKLLDRLDSRFR
jgi:DNA-binding transcriptional regulator YiaG